MAQIFRSLFPKSPINKDPPSPISEISQPTNVSHNFGVKVDGKLFGNIPKAWVPMLKVCDIPIDENTEAVVDAVEFWNMQRLKPAKFFLSGSTENLAESPTPLSTKKKPTKPANGTASHSTFHTQDTEPVYQNVDVEPPPPPPRVPAIPPKPQVTQPKPAHNGTHKPPTAATKPTAQRKKPRMTSLQALELINKLVTQGDPHSKYKVSKKKLGAGASGTVVLGKERSTDKEIAIKVMNFEKQNRKDLIVGEIKGPFIKIK